MESAVLDESRLDLWPFEEARKLIRRVASYDEMQPVILEGGFGPSGLPHLGTMGEVLRPSFVRHALALLGERRPTRLVVFIDDMDGLRKVPENFPAHEATMKHLGEPVSRIPDPFGCCESFAAHMIEQLRGFLAPIEIDYDLVQSSEMYSSGKFDEALRLVLSKHEEIIRIVAPTLREENRAGWSPFMPICPGCGQVNSTRVAAYHADRGTVDFLCERSFDGSHGCGFRGEQSVLGGRAKVQWKVDWALRWHVLKVDYELYGKDLIDSARLSGQIVRLLGSRPPLGFAFEMYLDEEGHKVSKSVGRGVGVEQWRRYAPIEALKYFLILNPRRARKLFLESIPQYVDEYLAELRAYAAVENESLRTNSPLEFVLQQGSSRRFCSDLSYAMIINLVSALGTTDFDLIQRYLLIYDPKMDEDQDTVNMIGALVSCALNYYADFVKPAKKSYRPAETERRQLIVLKDFLDENPGASAEQIEKAIYDLGRANYDKPGKIFSLLYRVILRQERGPRLGAFIRLLSPAGTSDIIADALETAN